MLLAVTPVAFTLPVLTLTETISDVLIELAVTFVDVMFVINAEEAVTFVAFTCVIFADPEVRLPVTRKSPLTSSE